MPLTIGVVKETEAHEARVALTPDVAAKLVELGAAVHMQHGAGERSHYPDAAYRGVQFHASAREVLAASAALLKVQPPTLEEADALAAGAVAVGFMQAHTHLPLVRRFQERRITAFSVGLLPRGS